MSVEIVVHGRVVLTVWGTPEFRDLARVESTLLPLHERMGPLVFIGRVPPKGTPPDEHFRSALSQMLPRFMKCLVSFHGVLEGRGFFAAAKRTVLATAFLMSGERHKYNVHANVDEVPLAVTPVYRPEVHAAVMYFQRHGHCMHSMPPIAVRAS